MPGPFEWKPTNPPKDPVDELRKLMEQVRANMPARDGKPWDGPSPWTVVAVALLVWLGTGVFIVAPDQRGVVLRFGAAVRQAEPGPHYHLPWPIESVERPSVTAIRKEEIGFRTIDQGPPARYQEIPAEALMLTGDENIVSAEFIVQYKVRADASGTTDFLFNVRDPRGALKSAAEAAMREVLGRTDIDQVLTEGKEQVQQDAQKVLQRILDLYDVGLEIVTVKLQDVAPPDQVNDAFKDVISAQQDKERLINEANGYANDVVPRARGEAAQLINQAEGYREAKTRDATGVAQRFVALQQEYSKAKEVTRERLYLETMEAVLPDVNKIILDDLAGRQAVPYLPLEPLLNRAPAEPAPRSGAK